MCSISSVEAQSSSRYHVRIHKENQHIFVQTLSFLLVILAVVISCSDKGVASAMVDTNDFKNTHIQSTPKRGKFIGDSFNAKDLYAAYKEIESGYHRIAFAENSQHLWRTLVDKDDVEVSLMEHPNDPNCPYVRLKVEINVPVEDCWEFLSLHNWDKTMPKMDPFYEGVELHGDFRLGKVEMILARKRTNRIFQLVSWIFFSSISKL